MRKRKTAKYKLLTVCADGTVEGNYWDNLTLRNLELRAAKAEEILLREKEEFAANSLVMREAAAKKIRNTRRPKLNFAVPEDKVGTIVWKELFPIVMGCVSEGYTMREIAKHVGVSESRLKNQITKRVVDA